MYWTKLVDEELELNGIITRDVDSFIEVVITGQFGVECVATYDSETKRIFDFHFVGGSYSMVGTYDELIKKTATQYLINKENNN